MPRISDVMRGQIIGMLQAKKSQREVAKHYEISRCAVQNIWKKYLESGTLCDLPKCGRPRKNSTRSERLLIRLSKANPKLTAGQLKKDWNACESVSIWTVRAILRRYGLFGRIAARCPYFSKKQIKNRLNWCKLYKRLHPSFWQGVIFSDESHITLHCDSRKYVRRPENSKYEHRYASPVVKYGGKSIMIWGAIKYDGSRLLVRCPDRLNSQGYQDILQCNLLPFYETEDILQQDNAPCHKSKSTMAFMDNNKICLLSDWPAQSPDINIIENLWGILKRNVSQCRLNTTNDLWEECQRQWFAIPTEAIQGLYRSIPRRLHAVIRNKGLNIPY